MARPPSNILISTGSNNEDRNVDILQADSLYAVVYQDQPVNIRHRYFTARGEMMKYVKNTFPTKKVAENLAAKLNTEFDTNQFTVKKLI